MRPVQETDSFRDTSRRKVSAAEIADFDRPGEPILQCNGILCLENQASEIQPARRESEGFLGRLLRRRLHAEEG